MNKWKKMFAKLPITENVSWYLKENVLLRGNGNVEPQLKKNAKQGWINNVLMLSRKSANPSLTQNVGKKCKVVKKILVEVGQGPMQWISDPDCNFHLQVSRLHSMYIITYFMIFFLEKMQRCDEV